MEMKYSTKVLLGIMTFWPLIWIVLFVLGILGLVLSGGGGGPAPIPEAAFLIFFILHAVTILISLGLTAFYIIHAVKDESLKSDMKIMWALANVFGGMLIHPIYWYLRIWREQPEAAIPIAVPRAPLPASWMDPEDLYDASHANKDRDRVPR